MNSGSSLIPISTPHMDSSSIPNPTQISLTYTDVIYATAASAAATVIIIIIIIIIIHLISHIHVN